MQQQPGAAGDENAAGDTRDESAERQRLLQQNQPSQRSDPQHIHDAADKQQQHQSPAAANAVETVAKTERKRAARVGTKSAMPHDERQRRLTVGEARLLDWSPLIDSSGNQDYPT